ncbi:hypothetical protein DEU56DRAFT_979392 [Suillus clintonianus]|uniref:uncharacterized protein n=1 Tax=Suillus clintonianus TaxID=1904413 RepID=UPI001B87B89A|nr:uncharacterized protein DEU56DRAFT_979392 [Suillus clintonianus]KAG2143738.1 hypothetical protein DEU56DRAFT_979392 [Suillus clintonianus]
MIAMGEGHIAVPYHNIKKFDTVKWIEIGAPDGHEHSVFDISLSLDEQILASASDDATTRLCNLENNQPIGPHLHLEEVKRAAFTADGKFLAVEAGLNDLLSEHMTNLPLNTIQRVCYAFLDHLRHFEHPHPRLTLYDDESRNSKVYYQGFLDDFARQHRINVVFSVTYLPSGAAALIYPEKLNAIPVSIPHSQLGTKPRLACYADRHPVARATSS